MSENTVSKKACRNAGGRTSMRKKQMHITFHNPNDKIDSQRLAEVLISKTAERAINRYILEQDEINVLPDRTDFKLDSRECV